MIRIHCLKIKPMFFLAVNSGRKTFEIRKNDRNYRLNDILILREWFNGQYTGEITVKQISYVCDFPEGLEKGYIALGLRDTNALSAQDIAAAIDLEDSK